MRRYTPTYGQPQTPCLLLLLAFVFLLTVEPGELRVWKCPLDERRIFFVIKKRHKRLEREGLWKEVLLSREFGYNNN